MPRTLLTIVSGESLVNDATGLVIYRFAVIAVATGAFSLLAATLSFVYVVVAGVAAGLAIGWLITKIAVAIRRAGLSDELIAVSISLVTPFALYVPAEAIHASGVLAAMSGGIYMSRKSTQIFDADARIAAASVWNLLFFVFNGAAFVLIGLQLRSIVHGLAGYSLATLIGWSLVIAVVVIVVRYVWMFPAAYGRRRLFPKIREREGPDPPWQWIFVLSTAGMRGIVSLAAALALPETIAGGAPFPQRDLILFVTFVVILVTLVGEGLAMPWLIRRWNVRDPDDDGKAMALVRVRVAEAVRDHLRTLEASFSTTAEWEVAGRLHADYEQRVAHFSAHAEGAEPVDDAQQHEIERRMRREAYAAERRALHGAAHQRCGDRHRLPQHGMGPRLGGVAPGVGPLNRNASAFDEGLMMKMRLAVLAIVLLPLAAGAQGGPAPRFPGAGGITVQGSGSVRIPVKTVQLTAQVRGVVDEANALAALRAAGVEDPVIGPNGPRIGQRHAGAGARHGSRRDAREARPHR